MAKKTGAYSYTETDDFFEPGSFTDTDSDGRTDSNEIKVRRANPYARNSGRKRKTSSRRKENAPRLRQERREFNWASAKGKINFFLCALLVTVGCLLVIIQYVQVFSINTNIEDLRDELNSVQEDNDVIKASVQGDTMNMDALYSYATTALGMIESGEDTIVYITVYNQSYTTSSLPVQEIPDSKVTFHWFD